MKPIPQAMRTKLMNRFKAASTDSEPHIKLIATQTSMNTLMSEPIHTNVPAALGDVTVRQTYGDEDIAVAYAICIHNGEASIYQREMPANMDAKWEFVWKLGEASDVAIEYDGVWEIDASFQWYILRTQQFPYIFFVQDGDLYVQHWRDETTRTLLAEDVSEISSCRGWQNDVDHDLDQGLIIGYLRDGEVYYRSLCQQADESYAWETERKVTSLGTGNTKLSVIRTNDFRIGFLAQNGNDILLTLTHRNYAGQSFRPETLHCASTATFSFEDIVYLNGFTSERLTGYTRATYFLVDGTTESPIIAVSSAEKVNREEGFACYGVKIKLDKGFGGLADDTFKNATTVSYIEGSTTKTTTVSSFTLSSIDDSISLYFAADISRLCQITVVTPQYETLWYERVQHMRWYLPSFTVTLPAETQNYYAYDFESLEAQVSVEFEYEPVTKLYTFTEETLEAEQSVTFVLTPAGILPI